MSTSVCLYVCLSVEVERAGMVPWMGGSPDASFGFYLIEAFQSQTNTEKILYNENYRIGRTAITHDITLN